MCVTTVAKNFKRCQKLVSVFSAHVLAHTHTLTQHTHTGAGAAPTRATTAVRSVR